MELLILPCLSLSNALDMSNGAIEFITFILISFPLFLTWTNMKMCNLIKPDCNGVLGLLMQRLVFAFGALSLFFFINVSSLFARVS